MCFRIGEERLRQEYQRLVEGLRRVREERENEMHLANPGKRELSWEKVKCMKKENKEKGKCTYR